MDRPIYLIEYSLSFFLPRITVRMTLKLGSHTMKSMEALQ